MYLHLAASGAAEPHDFLRIAQLLQPVMHLSVDDAQAWYAHMRSVLAEGRFPGARVQPPAAQPYGALVTFVHDPSGVLLHFCEWGSPHRAAT